MLKILKLRKQKKEKETELATLREKIKGLTTREEELKQALEEAKTQEDMDAIDEELADLEKEDADGLNASAEKLEGEIADIDAEINEAEERARKATEEHPDDPKPAVVRGGNETMPIRRYRTMGLEERRQFVERDEIKNFLAEVRSSLGNKERAVNGVDVTIPPVVVDLLRPEIQETSKLMALVYTKPVSGTARQEILGTIPEAVWMEMTGALNELDIQFYLAEVDGYKVGGFIPIANSYLEDSDVALMDEIMTTLGAAIGYGIDKAIVYGTGTKQPLGIITRLAQTEEPSDYSDKMPPWVDLHSSHVLKASSPTLDGQHLFGEMAIGFGNCNSKYSQGQTKYYIMNEKTKGLLMAKLINFDSSGTLVATINDQMPVLGGGIILLDFMKDGDILGGYYKPYLLAERSGAKLAASEHTRFIEDQTVFRGTARYDGRPVIADSWVLFNIGATNATTSEEFAPDYANTAIGTLVVTSAAGTNAGDTKITVSPSLTSGNTYKYKAGGEIEMPANGQKLGSTWSTWDGAADITAATGTYIVIAECKSGKAVKAGIALVAAKA